MADYIYLLESRLSQAQQKALQAVREIARTKGLTVFLAGGAVRDLTSGSPVRDLDVVVQGNALKLRKELEKHGAVVAGELEPMQALYLEFPGGVRMEIASTVAVTYPKPGKPVVKPATIQDDLRRRDFTANAMALSLNEGSYGLLMDPLNGVADIENRELRLVSGYGFYEDPVRMIRATRFAARLGWQMEERTRGRYDTGKEEGYISAMSSFQRGYELEEIVHEDDPLRVLQRLEQEGWMKVLCPAWSSAKVNVAELDRLRDAQGQLFTRGIHADASAAQFPLITAKMQSKDVASLKKMFPRRTFVKEIDSLEAEGKKFAAELSGKQAATPSAAWKLLMAARPEAVLWVAYSTKNAGLQAKFKSFSTEWPQARQRIPYTTMQEMRITPELPGYDELVEKLFFELMDGKLSTPEEMKAYLEPYSPPAPPPPVHLRRPRAARKEGKAPRARKRPDAEGVDEGAAAAIKVTATAGGDAIAQFDGKAPGSAEKKDARVKTPAKVAAKQSVDGKRPGKAESVKAPAAKAGKAASVPAKSVGARVAVKKAPTKVVAKKPAPKKAAPAKKALKPAASKSAKKAAAKKAAPKTKKPAPKKSAPAKKAAPAKSSKKPVKAAAKKRKR
ncbi:MAG TPA: CCA tRNA nucleotidyltransferase [Acidobacteriaceae bacterium]|jgi:tRNA nucleotidyltransferase/poly(A) polymerase|nr:CCA tRNA nucleotidyltransferase [Acidobacteriaceae bacterium]